MYKIFSMTDLLPQPHGDDLHHPDEAVLLHRDEGLLGPTKLRNSPVPVVSSPGPGTFLGNVIAGCPKLVIMSLGNSFEKIGQFYSF